MKRLLFILVAVSLISASGAAQNNNKTKEARAVVNKFFLLLKSRSYPELYDYLPSDLQHKITREQLAASFMRLDSFITVERMELGRIQEHGDLAVINTTIYGKLKKPVKINGGEIDEGRIAAQQILIREDGKWKMITADNRSQSYFLKRNSDFNKQFQISPPRFEFKQKDKWTPLGKQQTPEQ